MRTRVVAGTGGWKCCSVDASCGAGCACNTVETCNQQLKECRFPFTCPGAYCEDESDGCGAPGGDLIPMSTTAVMTDDDDHYPWTRAGLVTMSQRLALCPSSVRVEWKAAWMLDWAPAGE